MLIYQGEQLTFNGYLKDDSGNRITNLSGYRISAALCKQDTTVVAWSTNDQATNVQPVTIGTGGLVSFVLPGSITRTLAGKYTFEAKVTAPGGESLVAISEDSISVAISNVGQRNDL